ncbi:hypothetical protein RchiOBHm_Chr7g0189391 [Rosa chinensis]|uniref:Secreted protein n=1 Tax=Rosa chinensis TaxID=74649 RepID=A0A2P6P4R3_ROSCH|nr:hypothetical protein RchiOBHm_Chr7g0189391 [Rosa chinensis]
MWAKRRALSFSASILLVVMESERSATVYGGLGGEEELAWEESERLRWFCWDGREIGSGRAFGLLIFETRDRTENIHSGRALHRTDIFHTKTEPNRAFLLGPGRVFGLSGLDAHP